MLTNSEKSETALVFIEFQEEWIGERARLKRLLVKDTDAFERSVENAEKIIQAARQNKWTIAHAGLDLSHDPHYLLFGEGKDKFGLSAAIPKAGTWQGDHTAFIAPFIPQDGEFIVKGRSGASVLKNSTLDPFLRHNRITTLILMGYAVHVCVESTLREAHDMGFNTYVVSDACGAFEPAQNDYFAKHVLHHFGRGVTSAELIQTLIHQEATS